MGGLLYSSFIHLRSFRKPKGVTFSQKEPEFSQLRSVTEATPLRRGYADQGTSPKCLPLRLAPLCCRAEKQSSVEHWTRGDTLASWLGCDSRWGWCWSSQASRQHFDTLLHNGILHKSAMAEDVILAPDLCSVYNAVFEHTKLLFTATYRNVKLSPVSCYGLNHRSGDAAAKVRYNYFIYSLWRGFRKQPLLFHHYLNSHRKN